MIQEHTVVHRTVRSVIHTAVTILIIITVAALFLALHSEEPAETLYAFFILPFTNSFYFGNMADRAALILICAAGFLLPAQLKFFNLGGEGQAFLAALCAGRFALMFPDIPQPAGLLAGCLLACCCAGLIGVFSMMLRLSLHINELISTYLVSLGIIPLIDYSINELFRDTSGNLIATPPVSEPWRLSALLPPSSLNSSAAIALVVALVCFVILRYSRWGYEISMTGSNTVFAQTQGIPVRAAALAAFFTGAALHGLAGALTVYGTRYSVYQGITSGLGWSGMSAALIGRNTTAGAVIGAFLFAWIEAGGKAAMITTSFSFDLSAIVQGIAFLLVTLDLMPHTGHKKEAARQPAAASQNESRTVGETDV